MIRSVIAATLAFGAALAQAGPREDALHVVDLWARAFAASDVDAIVRLYAPDATFFGTGSKALVTAPAGVRAYFENALTRDRPRGATLLEPTAVELSETVVLVTGLDMVTGVREGQQIASAGRVSFLLQKRPAGWQIVHFHRSALPK
jgi:uncharacterized protein (TIGR02246 family)